MKKLIKYIIYILAIIVVLVLINKYIYNEAKWLNSGNAQANGKNQPYKSFSELPQGLKDKIIYIEDRNFYNNKLGLDIPRIFKSIYSNILGNKIQGGSTIDQQLIKINHANYSDRNIYNKIVEILGAINLNINHSKDEILLSYVNNLPMTNNIVGVQAACNIYLSKDCNNLTDHEQYFIISIYQLGISPYNQANFDKIKNRSKFLCTNFGGSDCQDIYDDSPRSYADLSYYTLSINPTVSAYLTSYPSDNWSDQIYNQTQTIISNLKQHLTNNGIGDCCVVVLNGDGDLISMNLCRSGSDKTPGGAINMCTAKRQTGSAIKPFLYILGLHKMNWNSGTNIVDEPVTYFLENSNEYSPKNFDLKYHGQVTIAQALGNSLNIPAIKILHEVGLVNFQEFVLELRKTYNANISTIMSKNTSNMYTNELVSIYTQIVSDHSKQIQSDLGLSMALGTYNFTPLEFAHLWRIFLKSDNTSDIYKYQKQVDDVYGILSDFVNRNLSFGVDNWLNLEGWASKSGTSRHFVDGWTCGANRHIDRVVCVRVGNHDNRSATASSSQTASLLRNLVAKNLDSVTE